jgi:glucosamine--fructose-6-phosphate aminotransferase (isomerizing)
MCGIIGFIGNGSAAPVVFEGLKKLEYRGYDSAGIASGENGTVWLKKDRGRLSEVETKHCLSGLPGRVAIGHTRWATHGGVNQANSHPHLDCKGEIAVVHNGIIENHQELHHRLEAKHKFLSETDTEVVPHLIEDYMESGASLEKALWLTTRELKGSYALLAISSRDPDKVVGSCRDEPLLIGLGDSGTYIASDFLAFLNNTDRVIGLENGEIAVLNDNRRAIFDSNFQAMEKQTQRLLWNRDETTRQSYDYFMMKEIMEQPQAIRQTLVQDKQLIMDMAMDILKARQVIFTACGTSRHAALLGRYMFSRLGGKFSDVVMGSEFEYFAESIDRNTLVIAISQSGETADVLAGVKAARSQGVTIFSIINKMASPLANMSDKVLYLNCGPEIAVAATKSFTSQLVVLSLLAFAMKNRLDDGITKLKAISTLIENNFHDDGEGLSRLVEKLKKERDCYFIARGSNLHIAGEAALKLKEISYIHADGMPAGELKHGTLALIDSGTPVVAICPNDYTFNDTMSNVHEAKARGAFIAGVSDRQEEIFDAWIKIPRVEEVLYPLVTVVPLQLLAYQVAVARGLDPDKPRNLAKSVTVK